MVLLIDMLVDSRDVHSQHKFDVGKTRQNFHVTLKPIIELKRQRPSKVPLHLKEKLEKHLTKLKDADIIREMDDDDEMGSLFVNPIILMPKNDYVKLVIDARYLNSVTDLTNYSWPLEPVPDDYDQGQWQSILSKRSFVCLSSRTIEPRNTKVN